MKNKKKKTEIYKRIPEGGMKPNIRRELYSAEYKKEGGKKSITGGRGVQEISLWYLEVLIGYKERKTTTTSTAQGDKEWYLGQLTKYIKLRGYVSRLELTQYGFTLVIGERGRQGVIEPKYYIDWYDGPATLPRVLSSLRTLYLQERRFRDIEALELLPEVERQILSDYE